MADEINPRDFGRLESEVESLKELVRAQTAAIAALNAQMATLNAMLSEARGGWRTLVWIGGAAASVGGAVGWVLSHIPIKV